MQLLAAFERLLDLVFPPRDAEAVVRETKLETLAALVRPTLLEVTTPGAVTLLPYRNRLVRAVLREAKYKDNRKAQTLLGTLVGDYLEDFLSDRTLFEKRPLVLVPVPLSATRLRERGYNQVERIAAVALERLPPMSLEPTLLTRIRDTRPQTSLSAQERRVNLQDAFRCGNVSAATTYIVLDDVLTTGATLQAAVDALTNAGAQDIVPLSVSH